MKKEWLTQTCHTHTHNQKYSSHSSLLCCSLFYIASNDIYTASWYFIWLLYFFMRQIHKQVRVNWNSRMEEKKTVHCLVCLNLKASRQPHVVSSHNTIWIEMFNYHILHRTLSNENIHKTKRMNVFLWILLILWK